MATNELNAKRYMHAGKSIEHRFREASVKLSTTLLLALLCSSVQAADIASCSNPRGQGYFPEIGIVSEKDSGWSEDYITGGITKLVRLDDGKYDILFVDARKDIISARGDGGHVMVLNQAENVVSILVVYPGKTAEIYTFLSTTSGKLEYIHTLSRAGDGVPITKASVMRGDCDYINFDAFSR